MSLPNSLTRSGRPYSSAPQDHSSDNIIQSLDIPHDSEGINDELPPNLVPSSRAVSRASSYCSVAIDFDSLETEWFALSEHSFQEHSLGQLAELHDRAIALVRNLNSLQDNSDEVISLREKVEKYMENIRQVRFDVGLDYLQPELALSLADINLASETASVELQHRITSSLKSYLQDAEGELTRVLIEKFGAEVDRTRLVSPRKDWQRPIKGLRKDLHDLRCDIDALSSFVKEEYSNMKSAIAINEAMCKGLHASAELINKQVHSFNEQLADTYGKYNRLSSVLNDVKAKINYDSVQGIASLPATPIINPSRLPPSNSAPHAPQSEGFLRRGLRPSLPQSSLQGAAENRVFTRSTRNPVSFPNGEARINIPDPGASNLPPHRDSANRGDSNNSSVNGLSNLERISSAMRSYISRVERITGRDISHCSKVETLEIQKLDVRPLEHCRAELKDLQNKMSKLDVQDSDLLDRCVDSLLSIDAWLDQLTDLQRKYYMHLDNERSLLKHVELSKFTGGIDEMNVYEFIDIFNSLTETTTNPQSKAHLLYNSYLSRDIQRNLEPLKTDFDAMVTSLFKSYGDVRNLADAKLKKIASLKVPTRDSPASVEYYRTIHNLLSQCESLGSSKCINSLEISHTIYNPSFIKGILSHLPRFISIDFVKKKSEHETLQCPHANGKDQFMILKKIIKDQWCNLEFLLTVKPSKESSVANSEPAKPAKTIHVNSERSKGSTQSSKTLSFPCPFHKTSKHELGNCIDFFSLSNGGRRRMCAEVTACFTCLKPECFKSSRTCISDLPEDFICKDCLKDPKRRTPCILTCPNENHARPNSSKLVEIFRSHFKVFSESLLEKLGSNFHFSVLTTDFKGKAPPASRSNPSLSSIPVPAFDTVSGNLVSPGAVSYSSSEDSLYIFQMVKLKDKEYLLFFDSGGSGNLIKGSVAEELQLKLVDRRTQLIGSLADKSMYTEYGLYSCQLGPLPDQSFAEISLQGIGKITSNFPSYDLSAIVSEVRNSNILSPSTVYPSHVGGQSVDILIGCKTPYLMPKLLFWLPSGIGVFQSPFMDINQSRICFGGSHKSITQINSSSDRIFVNHLSVLFSRLGQPSPATFLDPDLSFSYRTEPKQVQLSNHQSTFVDTTPVSCSDIHELNRELIPQRSLTIENSCMHHQEHTSYKSKIPLSTCRRVIDGEEDVVNYRCKQCEDCSDCKASNRLKSSSLKERQEQKLIDNSISIDYTQRRVVVSLPFLKNPEDFFKKHFGSSSNYKMALSVYRTQCKKPPETKVEIRKVIQELVDLDFVRPIDQLNDSQRKIIDEAPVLHFYPWRTVHKDSVSTPLRLVVDPTASYMNLIVAKGESNLTSLLQVLMRVRASRLCFNGDIRKLYNNLWLEPGAYPFSLFLFHESLDLDVPPKIYVMLRAWYGNAAVCAQALTTLRRLGEDHLLTHPLGAEVLLDMSYVDDVLAGCKDDAELEARIDELLFILDRVSMSLKYIAVSGKPPPDGASSDGSIPSLGYSWATLEDTYSLSISELNFNSKQRGLKPKNEIPADTKDGIEKLLLSLPYLTRRTVVGKAAELFDPMGFIEPFAAFLRRKLSKLNSLDWDDKLPPEEDLDWRTIFQLWPDLSSLSFDRSIIPKDAVIPYRARIITCCDAGAETGGAAVYVSMLLTSGDWSCKLLFAKSKMMRYSIPRNELAALLIASEITYACLISISLPVEKVFICTDSVVSLCWSSNTQSRHKVFVLNRVITINRYTSWIAERLGSPDRVALVHIPGILNISDLMTKAQPKISDISGQSAWHQGLPWMKGDVDAMPFTYYEDLTVSKDDLQIVSEELYEGVPFPTRLEPSKVLYFIFNMKIEDFMTTNVVLPPTISSPTEPTQLFYLSSTKAELIDIVYHGWKASLSIVSKAAMFCVKLMHSTHTSSRFPVTEARKSLAERCLLCKIIGSCSSEANERATECKGNAEMLDLNISLDPSGTSDTSQLVVDQALPFLANRLANQYFDRLATNECLSKLSAKDLKSFEKDSVTGILFYSGRLNDKQSILVQDYDTNMSQFVDKFNFTSPAVMGDSEIFYAYAYFAHFTAQPHGGIESTLRFICQRFSPIKSRAVLSKIIEDCSKCKLLQKKTLQLEMSNHSSIRFTIAPAFAFVMLDLAQPFHTKVRWKGRQTFKCPALVSVCLVTGATSIFMMEDYSTESLVHAFERHICRYGVPISVYVDQGSQMLQLSKASIEIADLRNTLHHRFSIEVHAAAPKAHSSQGRVERKIGQVKDLLDRISEKSFLQSFLAWETTMAKISNHLNNLPVCRPSSRNVHVPDFDVITPNRLLLGFNNTKSLTSSIVIDSSPSQMIERNQEIEEHFFRLLLKRVHLFIPKSKWFKTDDIFVNDICLFFIDDPGFKPRSTKWHYGKVIAIKNNRISLSYKLPGSVSMKTIVRSARDVVRVASEGELEFNTRLHHKNISQ